MPQICIEYSGKFGADFRPRSLAAAVHAHLADIARAELKSCKTRLVEQETFIGDGSSQNAMVHVDIRLMPGRSDEQKQWLGKAVLASLEEAVGPQSELDLQLTVEVRELEAANYHKRHFEA